MKKLMTSLFRILLVALALCLASFTYHRILLSQEAQQLQPLGQLVELEEGKLSVYKAGQGDRTLVFLSGGGTASPILDFRTLTNMLETDYQIIVIEKYGYGFSDTSDTDRSLATILDHSRAALKAVGVTDSVVLVAHSLSGLEALYWAQTYPDEVDAIVGLDMSFPAVYDELEMKPIFFDLAYWGAQLGFHHWIPRLNTSDAITHGNLTADEKELYRILLAQRTASKPMIREAKAIKANAQLVNQTSFPDLPYLLFTSNGQGTGFSRERWHQLSHQFARELDQADIILLEAPHYLHHHKATDIAETIKTFLVTVD